jgi:hypothetical protein
MSERVVGIRPWLPWPLSQVPWWTEPIRAERLAAFRIGVAAVLFCDVLWTYIPQAAIYFGPGTLGSPELYRNLTKAPAWNWTLLAGLDTEQMTWVLWLWVAAAALLLFGVFARANAVVCWAISISIFHLNLYLHNGGDRLRTIALFYLIISPCAATWSLAAWRRRRHAPADEGPVFIHPWAVRLLFMQMTVMYYFSGLHKLYGADWRRGEALYYVLGDVTWTRYPFLTLPVPIILLRIGTWVTLAWELLFPLLVLIKRLRVPALWMGVAFHVGTGLTMELGPFPLYALCYYLPLVPWEQYIDRWRGLPTQAMTKHAEIIKEESASTA